MSNTPATNSKRFADLLTTLRDIKVYELDGHHADNLDEMQNRHHAVVSAIADYLEAEAQAFNWETGTQIETTHGQLLDAVFRDEIASNYQSERKILRKVDMAVDAYDRQRGAREAA